MAVIDVYEQYFEAEHTANGVERHGALVKLTADSESGCIRYEASVIFFPHRDEEDYAVSYDDCQTEVLLESAGRRSKKRDKYYLERIREYIDGISEKADAKVFWDKPLIEARLG